MTSTSATRTNPQELDQATTATTTTTTTTNHQQQLATSTSPAPPSQVPSASASPATAANETTTATSTAATTTTTCTKPPANNRSILILREIEPDSSEDSVRDIFNSENCPSKPVHCEYALQNSWYVTFKTDDQASQALAYIRKHIVRWKGKPIMARYKPKPAVPSAANQPPPPRQSPSTVLGQVAVLNHTGGGGGAGGGASPNIDAATGQPQPGDGGHQTPLTLPYHGGPYQAPPPPPASLPPHHHHPDGSLIHHPHHNLGAEPSHPHHLVGQTPPQGHPQPPPPPPPMHQGHPGAMAGPAGPYNPYYGQMIQAPWDLSTVFVFNGLSPHNKSSVSSVSLVGSGGAAYSQQHHNV